MPGKHTTTAVLARRYARALFDLAKAKGMMEAIEKDFDTLSGLFSSSLEFKTQLANPVASRSAITRAMDKILEHIQAQPLLKQAAKVMGQNRRLYLLPEVIKAFRALVSAMRGEVEAVVTSAVPLSDKTKENIKEKLAKITGKKITLATKVDKEILGGLVVTLGSHMLDSSLENQLKKLQAEQKKVA